MASPPGQSIRRRTLRWRQLSDTDLPALTVLASRCLEADGGQPFFADPDFVSRCYPPDGRSLGGFDGEALACASSLRLTSPGGAILANGPAPSERLAVTTGMVDPGWRRQGIGGQALDWACAEAAKVVTRTGVGTAAPTGTGAAAQTRPGAAQTRPGAAAAAAQAGTVMLRAESEALCDGAHALYLSRGLSQILAEDVLRLAADVSAPVVPAPAGLRLTEWPATSPSRFFAVYEASFKERPGFPGWSEAAWVEWITDDDDFMPGWTLLASIDGADVGFVAGDRTGWIAQVGVVPQARGRAVGAHLTAEVVRRMRAAGEASVTLNVNIDNPHAADLYRRLGFRRTGRRARYQGAV